MNEPILKEHEKQHSAALAPFVVEFTLALLFSLQGKTFFRPTNTKEAIHADMVPKVSQHVIEARMKEQILEKRIPKPKTYHHSFRLPAPTRKPMMASQPQPVNMQPMPSPQTTTNDPQKAWNKIAPLLNDTSVTHIECPGANKPLMISRQGRRQITKISLSEEEIKKILEVIAEQAHIPMLEGVFRAAVENYQVNAIISEIIGSKFIIKKNTPYSMIE